MSYTNPAILKPFPHSLPVSLTSAPPPRSPRASAGVRLLPPSPVTVPLCAAGAPRTSQSTPSPAKPAVSDACVGAGACAGAPSPLVLLPSRPSATGLAAVADPATHGHCDTAARQSQRGEAGCAPHASTRGSASMGGRRGCGEGRKGRGRPQHSLTSRTPRSLNTVERTIDSSSHFPALGVVWMVSTLCHKFRKLL